MKKALLVLTGVLVCGMQQMQAQTRRVDKCGMQLMHEAMIAKDPSYAQKLETQRSSLQGMADAYTQQQAAGTRNKTTVASAIPVIFHIVVDSPQFNSLGGTAGIALRCQSQIDILNHDFNKQNADSPSIPTSWKALYGNTGIHFGLAHKTPTGHTTPGYDIKIISTAGFSNENNAFPEAKTAATGLASWDVTKYYNVWCINFTGSATDLLGITVPKSDINSGFYPLAEEGVCILYKTLGAYTVGSLGGSFAAPYNLGRTLTHETGHFFEIWHTWGDDGGACSFSGGYDDGLADTPPEADAVFGAPAYTITGGTYNDACQMNGSTNTQPIGIACLSFMDYTNDNAMHLFTSNQAATMAAQVASSGENYTLTQNPDLLTYPVSVTSVEANSDLNIYPNPTNGQITVSLNAATETLNNIVIVNLYGQEVLTVSGQGKDYYSMDLSAMSKGIYFVRCNFVSGSVTRKILLQ